MAQNYSNTAVETSLSAGITAGATSITVAATTGFPSPNFTLVIDPDTASEELVLVTAVGGTMLTVTRGYDGTTGASHSAGAVVRHVHSAKDFKDSRDHEAATAAHGATGAVVGTTNVQVITNKDLTSGTNSFPSSLVTLAGTQNLTNKTLTAPALTAPTASGDLSGFGGAWTSYTPSLNGIAQSGASVCKYLRIGKTVHVRCTHQITSGNASQIQVGLPIAATGGRALVGTFVAEDAGNALYVGAVQVPDDGTYVQFIRDSTGGAITGISPFSIGSGDVLLWSGTYEVA